MTRPIFPLITTA